MDLGLFKKLAETGILTLHFGAVRMDLGLFKKLVETGILTPSLWSSKDGILSLSEKQMVKLRQIF